MDKPIRRILSLDGGPSVATWARCLRQIEKKYPGFLERTDLIVGSSCGACTGIYLASQLKQGRGGEELAEDLVKFGDNLLHLAAPSEMESYLRLLEGKEPMDSNEAVLEMMQQYTAPTQTMQELRPVYVTVQSCINRAPWTPSVISNWGANAVEESQLADIAIQSSSVPIWYPLREGHVDGGFFLNNPAPTGLATIAGEFGLDALKDVVLLSLGGDDGSSTLSNSRTPGDPISSLESFGLEALKGVSVPKDETEAFKLLERMLSDILHQIKEKFGLDLNEKYKHIPGNDDWGWHQWLIYPGNLLYLVQVWLNSMGRGGFWQCKQLLGERAFRLAPVGVMGMNIAFLSLFLRLVEPMITLSEFTAAMWKNPLTNKKFKFEPSIKETYDWVENHWMSD